MSIDFARRSTQREILDDHQPEQAALDRIYGFLAMANRRFGGTAATLARLERLRRSWKPGERIEILDVAAGAADIARAVIAWGARRGFDVRVTAVDISGGALAHARRQAPTDHRLRFVQADVLRPFCRDGAFDYVMSALFVHHLGDAEIVAVLRAFDRIARRGIIINDLRRSRRAHALTWLLTWPFDPVLHHDGPLSVRRALTEAELLALACDAGLEWLRIERHFGERITLAGERRRTR